MEVTTAIVAAVARAPGLTQMPAQLGAALLRRADTLAEVHAHVALLPRAEAHVAVAEMLLLELEVGLLALGIAELLGHRRLTLFFVSHIQILK